MKIKNVLGTLLVTAIFGSAVAQTDINLELHHKFEGSDFQYGTTYDLNGTAVNFSRVNYYLSGFELTHDGGQTTTMPDAYILASGNITSYPLGQESVTTLEGISFDLGVDSLRNHMGTSFWSSGHPLSSQSPTMDWNWPDGYFFWTISGKVDDNGDGTPNKSFEFHGIGDHLLVDVNSFSSLNVSGGTISLDIYVNIADWVKNFNLATVGFAHDGGAKNQTLRDNTNDETVFTLDAPLGLSTIEVEENKIWTDYTVAYAPTVYYDLATNNRVDIQVYDMSGKMVLEATDQNSDGNFFIRKELKDGTYLITFSNSELSESHRFVVKN